VSKLEGLNTAGQWAVLLLCSALVVGLLELIGAPGVFLIGPMLAGIVVGTNGGAIRPPRFAYRVAQILIALMIASSLTPSTLSIFRDQGILFVAVIVGVLIASNLLGILLTRLKVLPGTTAIWGCAPGGASAMVILSESFGGDVRLVAFMQYLRVVLVSIVAALVVIVWTGHMSETSSVAGWAAPVEWVSLAQTLGLGVLCLVVTTLVRIPGGSFLLPLVVGSILQSTGLIDIEMPLWLAAASYIVLGWYIGLGFTSESLQHARRALPSVTLAILALIAICGGFAWLLHVFAGVDPLTAYLAASPGGLDTVAILAMSSHADVPFVLAMQTFRLVAVMLVGPYIARFVGRRQTTKTEETPTTPLD